MDDIIARPNSLPKDMKWGYLCLCPEGKFYHFCTYTKEPTKDDLKHFLEELKTDEEFEMTDKEWKKDFQVYKITPDEFDDIMEIIGVPQDAN
jgi:hypothetical protein